MRRSKLRRPTIAVVSTLIAMILVEALLQIAALVVWLTHDSNPAVAGAVDVLCVGDSFTEGWGASSLDRSYPGQMLAKLPKPAATEWKVLNLGRGGQNSRDVLSRLPSQLINHAPKVVCVLIGANDSWSRPAELTVVDEAVAADDSSWRWRWRLPRLVAMAFTSREHGWQNDARKFGAPGPGDEPKPDPAATATAGSADLVGEWQLSGAVAEFHADGTLHWSGLDGKWTATATTLTLVLHANTLRFQWRIDGDQLRLTEPQGATALELTRAKPSTMTAETAQAMLVDAWAAQGSDPAKAEALFAEVLRASPVDEARARMGLTLVLVSTGRVDAAKEQLARLREMWSDDASHCNGESYVAALSSLRLYDEVLTTGQAILARYPKAVGALFALGLEHARRGNHAETVRYMTAGAAECLDKAWAADMLRMSAEASLSLKTPGSRRQGLEQLVAALERDGNVGKCSVVVVKASPPIERTEFEPVVRSLSSPQSQHLAWSLFDPATTKDDWQPILDHHLERMVAAIRKRGAMPVLLTYPFMSPVDDVWEQAAARLDVPLVRIGARFAAELKTRDKAELFVADGHCNDAGYAIMAEEAARVVAPLLR